MSFKLTKLFFGIAVSMFFLSTACLSQTLVSEGNQWNDLYFTPIGDNGGPITTKIHLKNDVVLNNQNYKEIHTNTTEHDDQWQFSGLYIREDNSRVYASNGTDENILYDFNAEVNDVIQINETLPAGSSQTPGSCTFKVVTVDSIDLLNGERRKQLTLIRADDFSSTNPIYGFKYWIEGMGSMRSLLNVTAACYTDNPYLTLCAYSDGQEIYNDASYNTCFIQAAPAPVTYLYFEISRKINNDVTLNWSTSEEENNYGFYVERSHDLENWEEIGFIKGNNTTDRSSNYTYLDNNIHDKSSTIYYRLKQEDWDGRQEYSDIKSTQITRRALSIEVFPNPTMDFINISSGENFDCILRDRLGRIVVREINTNNLDLSSLDAGLYLLTVKKGSTTVTHKIWKK